MPTVKATKLPKTKHRAYRLEVELIFIEPRIWRTVWVESNMTLHMLHHILQAAMGWTDAHLHEFTINGKHYGLPDPEDMRDVPVIDERKQKLGDLLEPHLEFSYIYDFGDDWVHKVLVKETEALDQPNGSAFVEAGAGACPPEDCGGMPGYQQFLDKLRQHPKSKEVKEFLRWAREDFNPDLFDRHAANAALLRMAWNGWVLAK
ncbi:plasmid pRiA4b ORF-3 family protein [Acidithiobacillus sp. IBUN Pt1247-S3]|uniref:plasmid pRiA4b ORF-3 family protein n=1 Tax=Acidithiobacillus sp. IBUN Pt1247-S3 TaxID=3166642 RepID=UPI0034E4BE71